MEGCTRRQSEISLTVIMAGGVIPHHALVGSYEGRLLQDVALHGPLELCPCWLIEVPQDRIQRVQLEEIAVAFDGRTGAVVPDRFGSQLKLIQRWTPAGYL